MNKKIILSERQRKIKRHKIYTNILLWGFGLICSLLWFINWILLLSN